MILWWIDTRRLIECNFITFYFEAKAEQIEKCDISLDDMTNMITNHSILNIPNQFLVQCRKKSNVIYKINLLGHVYCRWI